MSEEMYDMQRIRENTESSRKLLARLNSPNEQDKTVFFYMNEP